ncbi:Aste57867_12410 [Aphanomyces stellatus]|uniref:Aste57867_12410 protein n=1 Tax=Aphanomyces stellatus TaxID=120398 RepID=A0A485KVG6_9STRA|nr:hypothetical protein As57867_012364 [Aphanomyces stellatus]VFT89261.1 Aste57867_12410 [Aphanomyces stellatus]
MDHPSHSPYIRNTLDEIANRDSTKRRLCGHTFLLVLTLLNCVALYILVVRQAAAAFNTQLDAAVFSTAATASIHGKAVSLVAADGSLRAGAGTSVYLDAVSMASMDSMMSDAMTYFYLAPSGRPGASSVLATYYMPESMTSVLTTVMIKSPNLALCDDASVTNMVPNVQFQGIVTLNDKQAILLEAGGTNLTAVLVTINADMTVVYGTNKSRRAYVATGSIANTIGRISATQFATTYYDPYVNATTPYYQNIRVGTVASDGSITMSRPLRIGMANTATDPSTMSTPVALPAVPNGFLVTYYNANSLNASGLCVVLVTSNATAGASILNQLCNTKYQPAYFVDSTPVADNTVVFAFHDKNNNYALTLATLQVTSSGQLVFRGDYVLSAVAGSFDFGTFYSWYPKPIVRALNGGTNLALLFLNPANAGRPTTQVLQATSSFAWSPVSPLLPLSDTGFTLVGATAEAMTGTVTLDLVPLSTTSYMTVYSGEMDHDMGSGMDSSMPGHMDAMEEMNPLRISVVEFLDKPIGVGTSNGKSVVLNGRTKLSDANLRAGSTYFTTTMGDIVAAQSMGDYYMVGNSTLVTADARIGIAISKDTLDFSCSTVQ